MEAGTTSSATPVSTRTTGSPIGRGNPIPPLRRNNYGVTIGGPIIKNKTFFFFDYDGLRSTGLSTARPGFPAMLCATGDFGEVCTAAGRNIRQHWASAAWLSRANLGSIPAALRLQCGRACERPQYFHSLQQRWYLHQSRTIRACRRTFEPAPDARQSDRSRRAEDV